MNACSHYQPAGSDPTATGRLPAADWARQLTLSLDAVLERRVMERTEVLQAAWERERDRAEMLTRSLLMPPASLRWPELDIAVFYEAAYPETLVGGDFYDCFPITDFQIGLVLGDVCGKGLVAAMRIPAVKFALRGFLSEQMSPARAMTCLNELLCLSVAASGEAPWPVALSLVVLDRQTGELSCAVAGAEKPLILRADGAPEAIAAAGLLLGVEAGNEYCQATARLDTDAVLLMVTDGITEARRSRQMFGSEGVAKIAARTMTADAPEASCDAEVSWSDASWQVGAAVLAAARDFCGGRLQDDACVLAARFLGNS